MAFAVYENFEKLYGLCYNNKHWPPPNVILAVAVTWEATTEWHFSSGFEPLPKCYSVVAHRLPFYSHRRNGIRQ